MPRWLQLVVVCIALLGVAGVPAMAASALRADPCASGCAGDAGDDEPEVPRPGDDCPDSGGLECSPFCHACACFSPHAGAAGATTISSVLLPTGESPPHAHPDRPPPSPQLRGVFHPPRLA